MRNVYTYSDVLNINTSEWSRAFAEGLVITSSREMAKGVNNKYNRCTKAIDFDSFLKCIYPRWKNSLLEIEDESEASEFFNKKISESFDESERNKWIGYLKSRHSFISAIKSLEMAGLTSNSLNGCPQTPGVPELRELWAYRESKDASNRINDAISALQSSDSLDDLMEKAFGIDHQGKMRIILLGLYYITAIEERIFSLLESKGYEIVILANYDSNNQIGCEIWKRTLADLSIYPPLEKWIPIERGASNPLGDIFEKRDLKMTHSLILKKYPTIINFARDISDDVEMNIPLYATNTHAANELLLGFFPHKFKSRSLLSYPIGRFINTINQMWSQDEGRLVIDNEKLTSCFAAGWISSNGRNSRELLIILENILPFFRDCKYVEDWESRIDTLKNNKKEVSRHFRISDSEERWDDILSNPFGSLGILSPQDNDLDDTLAIIRIIVDLAKKLFLSEGPIKISDYFETLEQSLRHNSPTRHLLQKDAEVLNEIMRRVRAVKSDKTFMAHDIASAVQAYLSGRLDDEYDRNERKGLCYSFNQVDSAPLNDRETIHIIFSDSDSLPGTNTSLSWPLTTDIIRHIEKECTIETKRAIRCMDNINNSKIEVMRYCLFSALQHSDVIISWVEQLSNKILAPSPYIKLISSITGLTIKQCTRGEIDKKEVSFIEREIQSPASFELHPNLFPVPEPLRAYASCPRAMLYGYVLERRPVYSSAFQQQFAVSGLASAFTTIAPEYEKEIEDSLLEMLPHLRKLEKRTILDHIYVEDVGRTEYKDCRVTDLRYLVENLTKEVRDYTNEQYSKLGRDGAGGNTGLDLDHPPSLTKVCKYCPHSSYCRRAAFSIDQGGLE